MKSMKLIYGVLSFFVNFAQSTFAYSTTCANKLLEFRGTISALEEPIFSTSLSLYAEHRKIYGRNVSIKVRINQAVKTKGMSTRNSKNRTITMFTATSRNENVQDYEFRFPITASALVAIYNLPGYSSLTLSVGNMVGIYNGHTKFWNNTYIANNNPNVTFPDKPIKPIARFDNDASTAIFTQVLTANNVDWQSNYGTFSDPVFVDGVCCNSSKWQPDTIYLYGNMTVGMVGIVASIPYSIGYATLPSLAQYTVNQASFNVKTGGAVINPTIDTIQAAMRFYLKNSDPNDLMLKLEAANDSDAYPMSVFTYMVFNRSYIGIDCCLVEELIGFLDWYLFTWSEDNLDEISFIPLLLDLKQRIKRLVIQTVTCEGELVYPRYLASTVIIPYTAMDTWEIAVISAISCLMAIVFCFTIYMYCRRKQSDETRWMVDSKWVKILVTIKKVALEDCSTSKANSSFSNGHNSNREHKIVLKNQMMVGEMNQSNVFLNKLSCKYPQNWSKPAKRLMTRMKNLTNKNIMSLFGVTVLNTETYSIFEHCSKGTLHFVLQTTRYHITDDLKYQFAIDISRGMHYLHQNRIVHGSLNSLTCYLDSSWNVKVAQWERISFCSIENLNAVFDLTSYTQDSYLEEEDLIKFIYVDPQIRRAFNESVDAYSFGLLLVEIFSKQLPYMTEVENDSTTYNELLTKKFLRNYNMRPKLDMIPKRIAALTTACMSTDNHRPNFQKMHSDLKGMTKISTGIVDIILNTLEQHAEKLEETVQERTAELNQVTNRMRILLNEVLPPQIADKLFNGEPVPPEFYECVTIYFSDIVGFTDISARSSPMDVMTLLNDLWLAFDAVIDKYNVYKVDTIGDAYMVCSGLPIRNGNNHFKEIALLALDLMDRCNHFKIKHLPTDALKIRIGINSGPVTAGVVGSKMPQYCVFGDAVNTAARMESTSEEQRIQISSNTYQMIHENFPNSFRMEFRGEIFVKGKGNMETFWLLGTSNIEQLNI